MRDADERRRRVSKQLHDGPAQMVSAVAMSLELLPREQPHLGEAARSTIASAQQLLQDCSRELSRLCQEEHPPFLGEGGLLSAVLALGRRHGDRLRLDVDLPRPPPRLGLQIELGAYRLLERAAERSFAAAAPLVAELRLQPDGRDAGRLAVTVTGTPVAAADWEVELRVLRQRARMAGALLSLGRRGRQIRLHVRFPAPRAPSRDRKNR